MDKKRIILLLDGTWNDMDVGATDTNIVRLLRIISRSLRAAPHDDTPARKLVSGFRAGSDMSHHVFYERGVGTAFLERTRGGAFGYGLARNVRRAYRFLSYAYRPGDEVFVFGFSRGAYTARSLVGWVHAAGLLTREHCTEANEAIAWEFYRTSPNDRLPGVWSALTPYVHERTALQIECVGVFDTVGALGVPVEPLWRANRERFAFHSVTLSSITRLNLHALALDEHRSPFRATVWRTPPFKRYASRTEQVWFPGAHSDIGGGYIDEERRAAEFRFTLDDIALVWMLRRIRAAYPDFPADDAFLPELARDASESAHRAAAGATLHDSRTFYYRLMKNAVRSIANHKVADLAPHEELVGYDRHEDTIGEMVHVSALERRRRDPHRYAPKNLLSVLPLVRATYAGPAPESLPVVKWDGTVYDPDDPQDCRDVLALLG